MGTSCTHFPVSHPSWLQLKADMYKTNAETNEVDIYTVYYGGNSNGIAFLADHVQAGSGFSLVSPTANEITGS